MTLRKIASAVSSMTVLFVLLGALPSSYALDTPNTSRQQSVTWGWADGADKKHRDFSEDDYADAMEMAPIKVTATLNGPSRRVILEVWDPFQQGWTVESQTRTDGTGIALLRVNPYCDGYTKDASEWCDRDTTYRIRVLKSGIQRQIVSKPFLVTFVKSEDGQM
jgi:hypothetical protein